MTFLRRKYEKEIMDDFSISDERIDFALKELKVVNKYLGGINTSLSGLRFLINHDTSREIKVLDIGSGTSDIFEDLKKEYSILKVYSLDMNKRTCEIIQHKKQNCTPILGDVLNVPVKQNQISIVHASLLLHHFNEVEIIKIIQEYLNITGEGIIINDLRRSILAYLGIKLLVFFFSKSLMVKNDAPLSVKRGFIKSDLLDILDKLRIENFVIKRKWAFRWLIIIPKNQK